MLNASTVKYVNVEVFGVKVPVLRKLTPEGPLRFTVPDPAANVALSLILKILSTVVVGLVPPKVVVKAVEPSPMVRPPKTRVPAVPAQEAPFEPMQLLPEAEDRMVVVPPEDWFKVWEEATLMFPELALAVLPTVRALEPRLKVPDLTFRSFLASTATPAVKLPVPLIFRL